MKIRAVLTVLAVLAVSSCTAAPEARPPDTTTSPTSGKPMLPRLRVPAGTTGSSSVRRRTTRPRARTSAWTWQAT